MRPFYNNICRLVLVSIIALPMITVSAPSKANVTITPTLVVIQGRERYADINLINITQSPHTYAIGWSFMKMIEGTGLYENQVKSTTDFDLTKNVVFTPKRVTLEPQGLQKIRLGLRLKGEPPAPGDYRAHIELKDVSRELNQAQKPQSEAGDKKGATVGVGINVGFSIPVIYRVGESTAQPVFGTITTGLDKVGRPEVIIPVSKIGGDSYGVLGRLQIIYDGKLVGEIKNANIFPEVKNRTFKIPLNIPKLSGGSIQIVYRHFDVASDIIYAEKTIPVGK